MKVLLCALVLVFIALQVTPSACRSHTKSKQKGNNDPSMSNEEDEDNSKYDQAGSPYSGTSYHQGNYGSPKHSQESSSEGHGNAGSQKGQSEQGHRGGWMHSGYQEQLGHGQNSEEKGQSYKKRPFSPLKQAKSQKQYQHNEQSNEQNYSQAYNSMENSGRNNNKQNYGEHGAHQSQYHNNPSGYGGSSPKHDNDDSQSFEIHQAPNWTPVKRGSQETVGRFLSNKQRSRGEKSSSESDEHKNYSPNNIVRSS